MPAVRVRFAPSPTGILHLGNARAALFNFLFAKKHDGAFILRLDDTDTARTAEGSAEAIMTDLTWLGLTWTEGPDVGGPGEPYRQSERGHMYENYEGQLLGDDHAYRCFCTAEELDDERAAARAKGKAPRYSGKCAAMPVAEAEARAKAGESYCLRFRMRDRLLKVDDLIKGRVAFNLADIGDFVIVRNDGNPTYNFASSLDDGLMNVSHVIRGEDHLSNTPRQVVLMEALGLPIPKFAHVPLLSAPGGGGLSKRDNDGTHPPYSIAALRARGYLPEAITNYLFTIGGGRGAHGDEKLTTAGMVDSFQWDTAGRGTITVDESKLRWFNQEHLADVNTARLLKELTRLLPHDVKSLLVNADPDYVWDVIELVRADARLLTDFGELMRPFLDDRLTLADAPAKAWVHNPRGQKVLSAFQGVVASTMGQEWTADTVTEVLKATQEVSGHNGRNLFMPIRIATCGVPEGPGLKETLVVLGFDRVQARIEKALE